jgi:methylaspartate ammonia-lyase
MRITDILSVPGVGGYFYDDQLAIRRGAERNGEWYEGSPITEGFVSVRMPAASLGIGLMLEDGSVHWGDAMSVQYAGVAGRDAPFSPGSYARSLVDDWFPNICGRDASGFRENVHAARAELRELSLSHTALEYGLTQALLGAAAHSRGSTMAEVVCEEFGLPLRPEAVPLFAQSGERRRGNVDKMVMKRVEALPHGLISSPEQFGADGGTFLEYVRWVRARVKELGSAGYDPVLHFDVYGLPGQAFEGSPRRISAFLEEAAEAASPYRIRIESPLICATRAEQIEAFRALRELLAEAGVAVGIVADEWCNTLEDIYAFVSAEACDMVQVKAPDLGSLEDTIRAVIECKAAGVGAYLGGSCTETEASARVCTHVAIATQPDVMLAKPGMGVDEGIMVVRNEQGRTLAEISLRSGR